MNNFTIVYRILKALESAMDADELDEEIISAERLHVSRSRRDKLLIQLQKAGYIENLFVKQYVDKNFPDVRVLPNTTITIKGLEYLEENSLMAKAKDILKEAKDLIPGL